MNGLTEELKQYAEFFNQNLAAYFPTGSGPEHRVVEAMFYSLKAGGKRLRPFLVCQTAALFGLSREQSLPAAAALECLHTYSLIHDDLPAMDNDDYRRGRPTCHKQFDEATAILAGDGLLTRAFEILANAAYAPSARLELISLLASAAGAFDGMVAGQMLDLTPSSQIPADRRENAIKQIELMKTGRLLRFACESGAVLGAAAPNQRQALVDYARGIGMAFQITDDILDVEGDSAAVGKTLGKDACQDKLTFVSLWGVEKSKKLASELVDQAKQSLSPFGAQAETLRALADFILRRDK